MKSDGTNKTSLYKYMNKIYQNPIPTDECPASPSFFDLNWSNDGNAITYSVYPGLSGKEGRNIFHFDFNSKKLTKVSNFPSGSFENLSWKSAQSTKSGTKKTTIVCSKGSVMKKVTSIKPVCPKGYKKVSK